MIHAYDEIHVSDAKDRLAVASDVIINDCGFSVQDFETMFLFSGVAKQLQNGNPAYISGMSGIELAVFILEKECPNALKDEYKISFDRTPEYWAGYYLAEYQWYSARTYADIFKRIPYTEIVGMYPVYHEMDITVFTEEMERRFLSRKQPSALKQLREVWGYSQKELAELSEVNIRSIQMFEQGKNDIDKAQASTLYRLSVVLHCSIEDLMQNKIVY